MRRSRSGDRPSSTFALHLFALWAVAVCAPVFDVLGKNPDFLAFRRMDGLDIVVFTLALAVIPPLLLFGLERAASLAGRSATHVVRLAIVFVLCGLVAARLLKELDVDTTGRAAVAAVVLAAAATALYELAPLARSFLTALSPAALVFPAIFLFLSPVHDLVFASDVEVSAARIEGDIPVLMVVFDEISTVTLMDGRERIDPVLYPNLARLGQDATWFRRATAVTDETKTAIPELLTGNPAKGKATPLLSHYPRNLFTFLGRSYRMEVSEEVGDLCPRTACNDLTRGNLPSRVRSLASDTGLVYLHLIAPLEVERDLPSVSETLGDFGADTTRTRLRGSQIQSALEAIAGGRPQRFLRVVNAIRPSAAPTLYYKHSLLPHVPFEYLPSGRRYLQGVEAITGLDAEPSWSIPYLRRQAFQRHILQMRFGDYLLGIALRKMRSEGLYDRALIVVTADGGEAFLHPGSRTLATGQTVDQVAATPLLVKGPGQIRGEIVDRPVRMIDVLPTIADLLGTRLPWRTEGRSIWRSSAGVPEDVTVTNTKGERVTVGFADFKRRMHESLERKLRAFGDHGSRLYGSSPLLGRPLTRLDSTPTGGRLTASVDNTSAFGEVKLRSGFVPALITGALEGPRAPGRALAVAVNGELVATGRSFLLEGDDKERFSFLVPESAFHDGANSVDVLTVAGSGSQPALRRIGGTG